MGYRELYQESNEQAAERFELVMERIAQIGNIINTFSQYFCQHAASSV